MYICDFSRSVGAGRALTRNTRGLTRSVIRLIVPPLPAVSRPSNTMQILAPDALTHSCMATSSPCRSLISRSYSLRFIFGGGTDVDSLRNRSRRSSVMLGPQRTRGPRHPSLCFFFVLLAIRYLPLISIWSPPLAPASTAVIVSVRGRSCLGFRRAIHLPSSQQNEQHDGGEQPDTPLPAGQLRGTEQSLHEVRLGDQERTGDLGQGDQVHLRAVERVDVENTVSVSLRASKAATTSISENATRPIDRPIATLPYWFFPISISVRLATAMNSPTRPQVTITPVVRIESPARAGPTPHQAGRLLVEAERDAERGVDEEVDPEDLRWA